MHQISRQSVLAMIESVEHQLKAIKTILFMDDRVGDTDVANKPETVSSAYTTDEEENEIAKMMEEDRAELLRLDEKEKMMQDIVKNTELKLTDDSEQH